MARASLLIKRKCSSCYGNCWRARDSVQLTAPVCFGMSSERYLAHKGFITVESRIITVRDGPEGYPECKRLILRVLNMF